MLKQLFAGVVAAGMLAAGAAEAKIELPAPDKTGGKPLMQVIQARKSSRNLGGALTPRQLATLLYAANGVSRPDGRRTIATARNWQDSLVYVALPDGVYFYNAPKHSLELVTPGDHRGKCGMQTKMHAAAAAVFILASDFAKFGKLEPAKMDFYSAIHAGSASQNLYLTAADLGLGSVVCGAIDAAKIGRLLKFPATQKVLLTQPVGVLTK